MENKPEKLIRLSWLLSEGSIIEDDSLNLKAERKWLKNLPFLEKEFETIESW